MTAPYKYTGVPFTEVPVPSGVHKRGTKSVWTPADRRVDFPNKSQLCAMERAIQQGEREGTLERGSLFYDEAQSRAFIREEGEEEQEIRWYVKLGSKGEFPEVGEKLRTSLPQLGTVRVKDAYFVPRRATGWVILDMKKK